MAAIGTIRKYSGIAVGLIGISILAFVLTDAFNTNSRIFSSRKLTVGIIDGQRIGYQDFERRFEQEIEKYKLRNQVENIDEATRTQIRDGLWQQLIDEIIYNAEYDNTGLVISPEELAYYVSGPDPHPAVKQFFVDPETKQFDRNRLIAFLKNMDQYPDLKAVWLDFEQQLIKEKIRQKYFTLIKQSMFASNLEARNDYFNKNQFANFDYVALRLQDIPDTAVTFTEAEVKKKYQEVKKNYKVPASRSFDYVVFEVMPTSEDTALLFKQLEQFKDDFKNVTNDSLFVEVNSDLHFDTQYHHRGYFNELIDEAFFDNNNSDTIIGPFEEDGYIKIAKLIDKKEDTVMYYRASHILIRPEGPTDEDTANALAKAREYKKLVESGEDFAMLAMRHSDDKASGVKGGDLGWFKDGDMVKPFMDAVKRTPKGKLAVVKSQFGAHLIKVTENPSRELIKVGIIAKAIEPSSKTFRQVYSEATQFRGNIKTYEDFEKLVREKELDKRIVTDITQDEPEVSGFPNSRRLVSWAFSARLHDISDILEFDNRFVVAALTDITEEGFAPLEKIRIEIENQLKSDKKKEILLNKFNEALKSSNDLQSIANAVQSTVENISNISFNVPFITGIGEEKYLTGAVFGMKEGYQSEPIAGQNGVYIVKINSYSKVEEPEDYTESINSLISNFAAMSQYETMESLKELADIKDYRYRFF